MRLEAGEKIADRYELLRALGEGGMGAVWAARDTKTDETVALKTLLEKMLVPDVIRRFLREARAAMAVKHPNVVRIREVVMVGEEPVIVMDYLQGESLKARVDRERRMALHDFSTLFVPVVSAIGTAHAAGIVHRDLKPDNIFLVRQADGTEDPRVVDFGIAKLTAIDGDAQQSGHLTTTGAVLGTPYYMSPEQVFGDKNIDHRSDIWSLGIIAYECLSGRKPVDGENIGQILRVITTGGIAKLEAVAPSLPREVCALVDRMLSYDRAKRPADLREVLDVFRRHTEKQAQSFGEATLRADDASALGVSPTAMTILEPPSAQAPIGASTTAGAAVAKAVDELTEAPAKRRGPIVAVVGIAIAAAVALLGLQAIRAPDNRTPAAVAPSVAASESSPVVIPSIAPSASAAPQALSATASASASGSPIAAKGSRAPVRPGAPPAVASSVASAAPAKSAPPSPPQKPAGAPLATTNPYGE